MSIRYRYDQELAALDEALTAMGQAAAAALRKAIALLEQPDPAVARLVIEGDKTINAMERDIEHRCMQILLRQQPVASDLRRVSTALKIVTDIERMADHAADIAEMTLHLCPEDQTLKVLLPQALQMAQNAVEMDETAVQAFVTEDLQAARHIIAADDAVDAQFYALKRSVAAAVAADPAQTDGWIDLLMIAKYLERLGDHAVNVAEWICFLKTGLYRGQQIV